MGCEATPCDLDADLDDAEARFNERVAIHGEIDEDALRKLCEAASARRVAKQKYKH